MLLFYEQILEFMDNAYCLFKDEGIRFLLQKSNGEQTSQNYQIEVPSKSMVDNDMVGNEMNKLKCRIIELETELNHKCKMLATLREINVIQKKTIELQETKILLMKDKEK